VPVKHPESLIRKLIPGLVLFTVVIACFVPKASSMTVTMPYIVYPSSRPGAPWDKIKFLINVTGAENPITNVTLFYSTNETTPRTYTKVPMELIHGDNFTGTWVCEIPPQKNGTMIYFYSTVIDSKGEDHSVITIDEPTRFEIAVYKPRFSIIFFSIEGIDEKNLLADIKLTFDIYWPNDYQKINIWLNNQNLEQRQLIISATERFKFSGQLDVKGLKLSGDATQFPLDHYSLNLNFSVPFNATTTFLPKSIWFGTSADYYIWTYSYNNKTDCGYFSTISVNTKIERRIEHANYYIFPILIYAFVLGSTYLLSSDDHIRSRLTVYLTLFVFAWQYGNTIKDSIPTIAIGVTFAEIAMNWLAYFTGIYIIATFLGNFLMNRIEEKELEKRIFVDISIDGIAIFLISLIFFSIQILRTPFYTKTLFQCIPNNLGFIFYFGLVFGWALKLTFSYRKHKNSFERYMNKLRRYQWAIMGFILISLIFFVIPFWIYQQLLPIFMAVGGLLFTIPIRYGWGIFKRPILKIRREVELRTFEVDPLKWTYEANRIIVENVGRSKAKNCKGWIVTEDGKERICWTVPKERPNASINVKDSERLDFCAYYKSGAEEYSSVAGFPPVRVPKRFASNEKGFPSDMRDAMIKSLDNLSECKVLITSGNAEPTEAKIKFEINKIEVEPLDL